MPVALLDFLSCGTARLREVCFTIVGATAYEETLRYQRGEGRDVALTSWTGGDHVETTSVQLWSRDGFWEEGAYDNVR